jgi:hypothetical protein
MASTAAAATHAPKAIWRKCITKLPLQMQELRQIKCITKLLLSLL